MQSRRIPQKSPQASASNMSPKRPQKQSWRRQRHAERSQQQNLPQQSLPQQSLPQQSTNPIVGRKVLVKGFPQYTQPQDLTRLFSSYGIVKVETMTRSSAVLEYSNVEEAKAAIMATRKVNIYGEFLNVSPHNGQQPIEENKKKQTPKREFPKTKEKSKIIPPSEIDLSGTFDEQLLKLLGTVELRKEEVIELNMLYDDVENVLQEIWPNCTATAFGSIASGLGIKSSDADCYVDVPHDHRDPTINHVLKAKRVLQQYPKIFSEIIAIPSANTPIVKFFHIPTSFNCDLTFKTPLGVRNSKLIAALIHKDPRFVQLAIFVKYWAKVHELSGTGKLTNYTIVMMIIFYLQQASALPAVEALQRDRAHDVIVDFWNTGWSEVIPPASVDSALPDLIGGFFDYYANFDFNKNIVCPFLGRPIEKELFKSLDTLPAEFERYKENVRERRVATMKFTTHMCVQDPFELCHNVASGVGKKRAQEVTDYFRLGAKIYKTEKMNGFNIFLKNILHENIEIRNKTSEYRFKLYPKNVGEIREKDWETTVRKVTFTIFEDILKLKLSQKSSISTPFRYKEKYAVQLKRSIWKRKQFSKLYTAMNMDFTQKEIRITEEILRVDKNDMKLQFHLMLLFGEPPKNTNVLIKLVDGEYNIFREFGKFFISEIPDWYNRLLKQLKPTINTAARIAESVGNTGDNLDDTNDTDSDDDEYSDVRASDDSDDGDSVTTTNDVNDTRKTSQ